MSAPQPSRVTGDAFLALIESTIPLSRGAGLSVDEIAFGAARMRLTYDPSQLRAGGTISGPTLMMLADTALYAMVLSLVGLEPLAVTTDLSFHFLRRPAQRDLLADARVLRSGRSLVVGEVTMRSDGDDAPVAHAVGTYALPKR